MTEPKEQAADLCLPCSRGFKECDCREQAVPVVGVEEAVEALTKLASMTTVDPTPLDALGRHPEATFGCLRTILQALQGSSLRDTHRATEQPVVVLSRLVSELSRFDEAPDNARVWLGGWSTYSGVRDPSLVHAGEIRDAMRQADSVEAALGGDEAEGGVNQDLQAQLKAAYEALEPFALAFDMTDGDGTCLSLGEWEAVRNAVGINDFRRARQAVARRGEG